MRPKDATIAIVSLIQSQWMVVIKGELFSMRFLTANFDE